MIAHLVVQGVKLPEPVAAVGVGLVLAEVGPDVLDTCAHAHRVNSRVHSRQAAQGPLIYNAHIQTHPATPMAPSCSSQEAST